MFELRENENDQNVADDPEGGNADARDSSDPISELVLTRQEITGNGEQIGPGSMREIVDLQVANLHNEALLSSYTMDFFFFENVCFKNYVRSCNTNGTTLSPVVKT